MYASFKFAGTEPLEIDRLRIFVRNGLMSSAHSLSSHVGHGSNADCLGGIQRISCVTSSQRSASNFVNWHPGPFVKVNGGEPSVSWRISTTFFVKNDMNSSAECSCFADIRFLPIRWFTVVQSLRESHVKNSILFVQNEWLFFAKYLCIFLTLDVNDALSDCALDVRFRFSRLRVSRLRAWQSSSNHGSDRRVWRVTCVIAAKRSRMLRMVESYPLTISPIPDCEVT